MLNVAICVVLLTNNVYVTLSTAAECSADLPHTTAVSTFNGKCYQFVNKEYYWTSARDYCWRHGGKLVTVDSAATQNFISDKLNSLSWRNRGVWIGLHDTHKEERYEWIPNEGEANGQRLSWNNWASGHPGAFLHSLRDCVRMVRKSNWQWHETPCKVLRWQYKFICEYAATLVNTAGQHGTGSRSSESSSESELSSLSRSDEKQAGTSLDYQTHVIGGAMTAESQQNESTESAVYVGVVTGIIVFVVIVIASMIFIMVRRRRQQKFDDEVGESFSNQLYVKGDEKLSVDTNVICDNKHTVVTAVKATNNQYNSAPRALPDIPNDHFYLEATKEKADVTDTSEYIPMDGNNTDCIENKENIYSEVNEPRTNHYVN